MAVPIRVPDLGTTVDEIKLVNWLVEEGDTVRRGDALAEVETDKAVSELECVAEGVLLKQMVEAGTIVQTGAMLAYVGEPGEAVPDERPAPGPRVSPVVRNLARKLGVNLGAIKGAGQDGVITRDDVRRAAQTPAAPDGEPLPKTQSAVARAVETSNREIPHLRMAIDIDMTTANQLRGETGPPGDKLCYDAIFLKAMAHAIPAVPVVAARWARGRMAWAQGIHIAVAVGTASDLFLPVVRDVDNKDLAAVHGEIMRLADQARAGTLKAEQMTGACIALSCLTMYPIAHFDAIVFPEHTCMVAVGAVQERAVVVDGAVTVRPMVTVKLAADHRLVNGRPAGAFLTRVKRTTESGRFT
jgi:pyruvate dehydrogenase E2 component (dihydrolipoyllysine-residue acetyltransferase)